MSNWASAFYQEVLGNLNKDPEVFFEYLCNLDPGLILTYGQVIIENIVNGEIPVTPRQQGNAKAAFNVLRRGYKAPDATECTNSGYETDKKTSEFRRLLAEKVGVIDKEGHVTKKIIQAYSPYI